MKISILYQAYCDGYDGELCDTLKEAKKEYDDLAKDSDNARLVKLFIDNDGNIVDQDILKSKGRNPLW